MGRRRLVSFPPPNEGEGQGGGRPEGKAEPPRQAAKPRDGPWLALTLVFAALPAAVALEERFGAPHVVQDDARQFIVWMRRWLDPALFPDDLVARYFDSVTPLGLKALYWLPAQAGVDPLLTNALLPGLLSLIAGWLTYRLGRRLSGSPVAGWLGAVLTLFFLWLSGESIASGLHRAFAAPLLLGVLLALTARRPWTAALCIAGLGLSYPQVALVALGTVVLLPLSWRGGRPVLAIERWHWVAALAGLAAALATLLPYLLGSGELGPRITAEAARALPAFQEGGRTALFLDDPLSRFLCGARGGALPIEWGCGEAYRLGLGLAPLLALALLAMAVAVPLALARAGGPHAGLLLRVLIAAGGLFVLAHLLLFELYLPSRFTQHALRAVAWIGIGVLLAGAVAAGLRQLGPRARRAARGGLLLAGLGFYSLPFTLEPLPYPEHVVGGQPALYEALSRTPKDSLIGTLSPEADSIPAFTGRSVLVAREFMLPYSTGYWRQMVERLAGLVALHQTGDRAAFLRLLDALALDYLVLDPRPGSETPWWRGVVPETPPGAETPLLTALVPACGETLDGGMVLLAADCLRAAATQ